VYKLLSQWEIEPFFLAGFRWLKNEKKKGTVYKLLSQWETAREYLRRSLTLKQKLFGATHPSTQLGEKLYQVLMVHSASKLNSR
jgi:hypothetical protein